jgi:hypothetical protein
MAAKSQLQEEAKNRRTPRINAVLHSIHRAEEKGTK